MKDNKLIIIASQPRSGSTLLQALLSNNNQVATVSEPWLLLPFLSYDKPDIVSSSFDSQLSKIGIKEFKEKIGAEGFDSDLQEFLLKQYFKILNKEEQYVLDKTPRYYEILDEIIKYFPNSRMIILKRNPLAVLSSIINTWNQKDKKGLLKYKRDILVAPKALHDFSVKNKNNPNVFTLNYEDMIKQPESVMKGVYDWLDIPFNSNILNYSRNNKFIGKMGDKIGVKENSMPNIEHLEKWKNTYNDKNWHSLFNGYANYLTNEFLSEYSNIKIEEAKETRVFNNFLKISSDKKVNTSRLIKFFRLLG